MKKLIFTLLLATSVSVNFGYSQDKQPQTTEKSGDIVAPSKEMQTFVLAGQLAKYGYENNSATALIQAAELYLSVGKQEFKPVSSEKSGGKETTKEEYISRNPEKLLADAKILSENDAACLAMISKVEKESTRQSRGAVGGPKEGEYRVLAGATDSYVVKFFANERATVAISGDGDTDLDLYIFDENGGLIAKDDDYSDDCIVNWNPRWTGQFVIQIINRGNVYNHYIIATN